MSVISTVSCTSQILASTRLNLRNLARNLGRRVATSAAVAFALLLLASVFAVSPAHAQPQASAYEGQRLAVGSFSASQGVAVDTSGNVYVADSGNNAVKEIPLSCITGANSSSCVVTLGGGFSGPAGVAVDSSGNVYVADGGSNAVKEIPLSCITGANNSSCVITLGGGFSNPYGVAVDGGGNVYVAAYGNNAVREISASCIAGANNSSCVFNMGGGFSNPKGVAVDTSGNVYVADFGNNAVKEIPLSCITGTNSSNCVLTLGGVATFSHPGGVAVDAFGSVYVADTTHGAVKEMPAGCASSTCVTTLGGGFSSPVGVALDGSGNLYLGDISISTVSEIVRAGVNFSSTAIASNSTKTLTFTLYTAGTIGVPKVLTQGATGLDFTDAGTGTCTTNGTSHSYAVNATCTVVVKFAPQYAGARNGAVQIFNASGTVIATANIYGTGTGPQLAYNAPITPTIYASRPGISSFAFSNGVPVFGGPQGVAVDGNGNIFVADPSSGEGTGIYELPAGCTSASCVTIPGQYGFNNPYGVAVDGSGNLYVADQGSGALKKVPVGCTTYTCVVTLISGINYISGIALDGSGNIYLTQQYGPAAVMEVPVGCTSTSCMKSLGGGFSYPWAVAVDASGNVYVTDYESNKVLEMPSGCTSSACVTSLGGGSSSFYNPQGVAVDAAGNVYVMNPYSNNVNVMPAGCFSSACVTTLAGGSYQYSSGVAVGPNGNVYIAGQAPITYSHVGALLILNRATPPTLTFAATAPNHTSTDSPQSFSLANIGNATLSFPVPASGNNPLSSVDYFTVNPTGGNACPFISSTASSPGILSVGASCSLPISFSPIEAGPISGSLTYTDNNLNAANATQSIPLSGTGTGPVTPYNLAFVTTPQSPIVSGSSAGVVTLQIENSTYHLNTSATNQIKLTVTGPGGYSKSYSMNAVAGIATFDLSSVTLTTPGIYTYVAVIPSLASVIDYATANSKTLTPQTITFTTPGSPLNYGSSELLTATGGASGNPVTFIVLSGPATISGNTLNPNGAGFVYVYAYQAGNDIYAAATSPVKTIQVLPASQTITFTPPGSPLTYPNTEQLSATGGASGNPVTFSILSGPAIISGTTLIPTGAGFVYVFANQAGNSAYSAATSILKTVQILPASQTITFTQPGSPLVYGTTEPLTATGGASGNPVTFSILSGPATISGNILTPTGTGFVYVYANQAGNSAYSAATSILKTVQILPASQTINNFNPGVQLNYGSTEPLSATGGASGNPVTFSILSGPATITSGNILTPTGTGFVYVYANQAAGGNYAAATSILKTVRINPEPQTITFTPPGSPLHFGNTEPLSATGGGSGNPVTFSVYSGPATITGGNILTPTGIGNVLITASQAGNANYAPAETFSNYVQILGIAQTITWTPSTTVIHYGQTLPLSATGGASGNPVTFSILSGPATISGNTLTPTGVGFVYVFANQAGNTGYTAATSIIKTFQILPATQTITWTSPAADFSSVPYGPVTLAATGGASGNPVTFSIYYSDGTAYISGNTLVPTSTDQIIYVFASQAGNANYSPATDMLEVIRIEP